MFIFSVFDSASNDTKKIAIVCDLWYAKWLTNTGRVAMGVYNCPGNRIYL